MGITDNLPLGANEGVEGPLFLSIVYGFILLKGAEYISEGSELLLQVISPGIIGGLVLPVLGALPDAVIIMMSGCGPDATEEVAIGIGTLAGSTIMLLTVAWAGSLVVGRCDLVDRGDSNLAAVDRSLGKHNSAWSLTQTGVTTDTMTRSNSWSMILSNALYLIVIIPALAGMKVNGTIDIIAMIMACLGLVIYCVYQIMSPRLQKRRLKRAKSRAMKANAVMNAAKISRKFGINFFEIDGSISWRAIDVLFDRFDTDGSDSLEMHEVKGLISGLILTNFPDTDEVSEETWMNEIDKNKDGKCSREEFKSAMESWLTQHPVHKQCPFLKDYSDSEEEHWNPNNAADDLENTNLTHLHTEFLEDEEDDDDEEGEPLTATQVYMWAALYLLGGSAIIFIFSDPLVDTLANFATATKIPKFVVGFVATPFASNSSELVSSLIFASKKRKKNISLTFSQVYGAVTMNNTMCFAVFMALFAINGLEWKVNFTIEILVMMVAILLVGFVAVQSETFKLWLAPIILLIYPVSLGVILALESAFKPKQ
mmetsp:Transcript_25760/g.31236  ORF Transcript_25760/g.31236 Transcript_25760/m.31236 type:complete len:540 (-) Transcript_25760:955-2574(-)|eukprot:CAMPEP_0197845514 /NCGR_PEP_ID=MMETSP1438-20131217/2434_1 /TAXON_ID=1461541 /ORGANISM="Pterosperma sp., Strain CCMP1384" /LENGTH=539 /DNA_ID=CAMNT_0043456835 /DNA_START=423 /DNA_END=2042 /DNA_ORIENTATION=+